MPSLRPAAAVLILLLLAPAAARAEGPRERGRDDALCTNLERRLDFLEALAEADPGPARAGSRLPWRQRLLARLAVRYADRCVGLNQVQALGTHNSYHLMPRPRLLQLLLAFDPMFAAWEYAHRPLPEQLGALGIRQLELDVFADPLGGHYAVRPALTLVGDDPVADDPALFEPGFKVLHVQDLDFESTCPTLRICLEELQAWSAADPRHLPVAVLLEAKDDPIPDPLSLGFQIPLPIDAAAFRRLDDEILAVFPRDQLLLPDDVRGGRASLEAAVLEDGWPTLGEARGRVLFLLDNGGAKAAAYRDGAAALEGRVLFTNATPGEPDAAFVKVNDPLGDPQRIPDLVAAGYLVRTRADADTLQARTGDTTRRDAALASGAQLVSTDYPEPDPGFGTGYEVRIPGGAVARCNPVNGPPGCRDGALDLVE